MEWNSDFYYLSLFKLDWRTANSCNVPLLGKIASGIFFFRIKWYTADDKWFHLFILILREADTLEKKHDMTQLLLRFLSNTPKTDAYALIFFTSSWHVHRRRWSRREENCRLLQIPAVPVMEAICAETVLHPHFHFWPHNLLNDFAQANRNLCQMF